MGTVLGLTTARLNLVLTDGHQIAATAGGDSLYVLADAGVAGSGTVVASEPCDDHPGWRPVADGSLVVASDAGVAVTSLGLPLGKTTAALP